MEKFFHCTVFAGNEQKYAAHTDQGASGHQSAQGTDHVNLRVHAYAKGGGKKSDGGYYNRTHAGTVGNGNGFCFALSCSPFFFITAGHQDRIIYGGSQLDRTDDDGGDEGQLGAGEGVCEYCGK